MQSIPQHSVMQDYIIHAERNDWVRELSEKEIREADNQHVEVAASPLDPNSSRAAHAMKVIETLKTINPAAAQALEDCLFGIR